MVLNIFLIYFVKDHSSLLEIRKNRENRDKEGCKRQLMKSLSEKQPHCDFQLIPLLFRYISTYHLYSSLAQFTFYSLSLGSFPTIIVCFHCICGSEEKQPSSKCFYFQFMTPNHKCAVNIYEELRHHSPS